MLKMSDGQGDGSELSGSRVVLFGRSTTPFGGAITYLADVSEALCDAGAQVTLAVNREAAAAPWLDRVRDRVEFEEFETGETVASFLNALESILESRRPDVLHFNDNNRLSRVAIPRSRALRRFSGERIVTLHADIAKVGAGRGWADSLRHFQRRLEVRRFVQSFDRVISVSEYIGARLQSALWIPNRKVECIANGVDVDRFHPRPMTNDSSDSQRPVIVGCAGNLVGVKRFDIAIRSVAAARTCGDVRLRVAGCGDQEQKLRRLAVACGIEQQVDFAGRVDDMPEFLRSVDILMCPSDSETSCYAQLEAMATGLPSVSSRYADLAVRVRDGVDGFLVTPGDVSGFTERLNRLVVDPQLRRDMGQKARERVVERYSREAYVARTVNVFAGAHGDVRRRGEQIKACEA